MQAHEKWKETWLRRTGAAKWEHILIDGGVVYSNGAILDLSVEEAEALIARGYCRTDANFGTVYRRNGDRWERWRQLSPRQQSRLIAMKFRPEAPPDPRQRVNLFHTLSAR